MTDAANIALCVAGMAAGADVGMAVTARLHRSKGFWSKQIGHSRFRRANIPVGFFVFTAIGTAVGDDQIQAICQSVATTMGVTAFGWAWVDPHA